VENGATLPAGAFKETPKTPPASLTDPLFEQYVPPTSTGGVITTFGMYKPWFYRQSYDEATAPTVSNCG
jgi:hypothetical protein